MLMTPNNVSCFPASTGQETNRKLRLVQRMGVGGGGGEEEGGGVAGVSASNPLGNIRLS